MGEIVRLQKYIAMCGAASRRRAEEMISEGRVRVNGERIREQGVKVEIGADHVELDGKPIKIMRKRVYIMLNKPAGFVTTVSDQFGRPTVMDLVQKDLDIRLFPVGRLDYETEGLLILTNDGDFANRVTHPKYEAGKTYLAELKGGITVKALNRLKRGVRLEEFTTSPAQVEIVDSVPGSTTVKITIHEGKNRQVRRMFAAVGCTVSYLKRISIGKVELGKLAPGRWRHLTSHEVNYLMNNG